MKQIIIFVVAGMLVGVGGGSFVRGTKERDIILERMAVEKAVADSLAALEAGDASHGEETDVHGATATVEGSGDGHGEDASNPEALAEDSAAEDPETDTTHAQDPHPEADDQGPDPVEEEMVTLPPPAGTGAEDLEAEVEGSSRMAKIFAAMEAKDAAAVLENLSNEEVQAILSNMSDRKVAEILGEFSPERAAGLSRIVLADRSGADR